MWEGGTYTAISIWLNNMQKMFLTGDDLPQLATVVVAQVIFPEGVVNFT